MAKYAASTTVSSDKSRAEIEKTLKRYGAGSFMYGTSLTQAVIAFEMQNRRIKFVLPMPNPKEREFTHAPRYDAERTPEAAARLWEQACRQRWRALSLAIKAKLESVECGITTFDEEFMAHIVLPNGRTMGELYVPQIARTYETKEMPPLLEKF